MKYGQVRAGSVLESISKGYFLLFFIFQAQASFGPRDIHKPSLPSKSSSSSSSNPAGTGVYSRQELDKREEEKERIFRLSLNLMENFGCTDFTEKGLKAFVEYLAGQKEFPQKDRTRAFFSEDEYARNLTGHFRLLNYTEKTDTPESKVMKSRLDYSRAFRALSKIMNEDLYASYGSDTDFKKIADDLDNPKSAYGVVIKQKLREALNQLNKFSGVDYLNVGCRIQGEPEGQKKNKLQVQLAEKDSKGNPVKVHLDTYLKRANVKRSEVVDSTVVASSAPKTFTKTKKPSEEVRRAVDPRTNEPAQTQPKPSVASKPAPKKETAPKKDPPPTPQTHTGAPQIPKQAPVKVTTPPAPTPPPEKPKPKTIEERAVARLPAPKTEKGQDLYSRFKNWLSARNKDSVDDFHKTATKILNSNQKFKDYLIKRNPLGELCTNYKDLSDADKERVLSKTLLVHLLTENFDNPKTENLGSYMTDSVGPWQISLDSKGFGCTFNDQEEIKYNIEKNIHCIFTFYSYREKNYDQIYGSGKGIHWTVFKEGDGKYQFFEEKFEPLFRESVKECKSSYGSQKDIKTVNGHTPASVRDFIGAAI